MDFEMKWTLNNGSDIVPLIEDLQRTGANWIPDKENTPENMTIGCAILHPTGVMQTLYNASCIRTKTSICQYKSCLTIQGEPCIFPFRYKNVTIDGLETELIYTECSSQNLHRPWCPTSKFDMKLFIFIIALFLFTCDRNDRLRVHR